MIEVVFLPPYLPQDRLAQAQVVVFDVLRATTTMVTALAHGAREVRLFGDIPAAQAAAAAIQDHPVLLGGERACVRIPGFDLGNSPAEYAAEKVAGATICLTTTNGTVAALACRTARTAFVGSLLNAAATAQALLPELPDRDTLLVCAGTVGKISSEDVIGAGAVLWQLLQQTHSTVLPFGDTAWIAYHMFAAVRNHLPAALRLGQGGLNLIEAGLEADIDRCARIDTVPLVVELRQDPLRAVAVE